MFSLVILAFLNVCCALFVFDKYSVMMTASTVTVQYWNNFAVSLAFHKVNSVMHMSSFWSISFCSVFCGKFCHSVSRTPVSFLLCAWLYSTLSDSICLTGFKLFCNNNGTFNRLLARKFLISNEWHCFRHLLFWMPVAPSVGWVET